VRAPRGSRAQERAAKPKGLKKLNAAAEKVRQDVHRTQKLAKEATEAILDMATKLEETGELLKDARAERDAAVEELCLVRNAIGCPGGQATVAWAVDLASVRQVFGVPWGQRTVPWAKKLVGTTPLERSLHELLGRVLAGELYGLDVRTRAGAHCRVGDEATKLELLDSRVQSGSRHEGGGSVLVVTIF
jgi:hypothetical protein